ncbi:MAG: hypothetical protein R3B70_25575 [Polyangiaceae bacterium]
MIPLNLIRILPPPFGAALQARDFHALLRLAEARAERDPDGAALVLWQIAVQTNEVEALQVLSYSLVRTLTGPTAEACRLWLLVQPTEDLSTLVNILTGLGVVAVERDGISDYHSSVLFAFLSRCLEHSTSAVRISVLDFLRDHAAARGWPRRIGRKAAQRLAKKMEQELTEVVVEEEVSELESIVGGLRSDAIPEKPTIDLAQINNLVKRLERDPNAAELASFARERRLRDHAQWHAQRDERPIVTIRVKGEATTFLSLVRRLFDLCRLDNVDPTANVWLEAPAASEARHLRARPKTTEETLDRLRLASEIAEQVPGAADELALLPPRQAEAIAKVLLDGGQSEIDAEFILTTDDLSEPQLVLPFRRAAASMAGWLSAAREAERAALERPEVYSDEVPQANTVGQVLQAVDAILRRGKADIGDVDNVTSMRQVNYYTHAARVLGFLDEEDGQPTLLGRTLGGKTTDERFRIAAGAFDESMIGRAWRAWAQAESLALVDPRTAEAFLHDRARGLTGSTIPRRASTLRGWLGELLPYYGTRQAHGSKRKA